MSYERTPEHRRLRGELIRKWKPWEKSTGPKTVEGKARAAKRGYKGGWRKQMQELRRLLKDQEQARGQLKCSATGYDRFQERVSQRQVKQ